MKTSLSILTLLMLSTYGAQAGDAVLIPQLEHHPRSIEVQTRLDAWKPSVASVSLDEGYAVKFDGGAIVAGEKNAPMIVAQTPDGELAGNPFCRIFPICNESPSLAALSKQADTSAKGIDLVDLTNNSPAIAAALAQVEGVTDYRDLAARMDDGAQLYQMKGIAVLAQKKRPGTAARHHG